MFSHEIAGQAERVLSELRSRGLKLATVESCTGGLLAAALTEVAGSSDVFERGFVTYSNEAKTELVGVPAPLIASYGAVSPEVARAMAEGGRRHSRADLAVSITGVAGPGGGSAAKPVGLVYLAIDHDWPVPECIELRLGDIGRSEVRKQTVKTALGLILSHLP